ASKTKSSARHAIGPRIGAASPPRRTRSRRNWTTSPASSAPRRVTSNPNNPGDDVPAQEDDEAFTAILQELRVVQTGVQILSAFLLTIPFTNKFHEISSYQKTIFVITLVAAAAATAFVI